MQEGGATWEQRGDRAVHHLRRRWHRVDTQYRPGCPSAPDTEACGAAASTCPFWGRGLCLPVSRGHRWSPQAPPVGRNSRLAPCATGLVPAPASEWALSSPRDLGLISSPALCWAVVSVALSA